MLKQKTLTINKNARARLDFRFNGAIQETGASIMFACLFGSWFMIAFWLFMSIVLFNYSWHWASLMLFCTLAFAWNFRKLNQRMDALKTRTYELKLDDEKIKLEVVDFVTAQHLEKTLFWKGVRWFEVCRYGDDLILVIEGWDDSIEVPLWAFGPQKKTIMQTLMLKHIPMVCIPQ